MIGGRYGKLLVIEQSEEKSLNGSPKWICLCNCGRKTCVERSNLICGRVSSCGKCRIYNTYDLSGDYGVGYTSNGKEFYFDLEDYEKIKQYNWSINGSGYLINTSEEHAISIHRLILNAPNNLQVDHINHNILDNRKDNLRLCNASQNNINKKFNGYTIRKDGKYEASININGKPIYLGRFNSAEEAINARKLHYDDDHRIFEYNEELVSNADRYF